MANRIDLAREGPERRRDAPSNHLARISWLLVTLLSDGVLDCALCAERFSVSLRQLQRDILALKEIGTMLGFAIDRKQGRVFLTTSNRRIEMLGSANRSVAATLAGIARSLGGPIETEIRSAIGDSRAIDTPGFLLVRELPPSDSRQVIEAYTFFSAAAESSARVEFTYTTARNGKSSRRVEPYHVVARSGRYYLIGYDLVRSDWRHFALDSIAAPMKRDGTFQAREIPKRYLASGATGWIRSGTPIDVTYVASPTVARAIAARTWQPGQCLTPRPDGSLVIVLSFEDLAEAVRWSLYFGNEVIIVSPPQAIALARRTISEISVAYESLQSPSVKKSAG